VGVMYIFVGMTYTRYYTRIKSKAGPCALCRRLCALYFCLCALYFCLCALYSYLRAPFSYSCVLYPCTLTSTCLQCMWIIFLLAGAAFFVCVNVPILYANRTFVHALRTATALLCTHCVRAFTYGHPSPQISIIERSGVAAMYKGVQ
jgi:hypothetical protein